MAGDVLCNYHAGFLTLTLWKTENEQETTRKLSQKNDFAEKQHWKGNG